MPRHDDDGDLRHQAVYNARKLQPVESSGHVDVGENGFGGSAVGEHGQGFIRARRFLHHIPGVFEYLARFETNDRLIVDYKDSD